MTINFRQLRCPAPYFAFTRRSYSRLFIAILLLLGSAAHAGNSYPLVLVHGFIGWGPEEMGGYHYWGGRDNIPAMLRAGGHESHAVAIGPVASNWDRACELYAYLKGGRVDYGAAHAARFGHQRYGNTFPGVLPDWGELGQHAKVHLVGHSQGGQTVRVITSLLARGDATEQAATDPDDLHPLFNGGLELIHSVTTLAAPHDGTTLATMLAEDAGYLLSWMLALADYINAHFINAPPYDFKLDHWGIYRAHSESDAGYRSRVLKSPIWQQADIGIWDLRPVGAAALNATHGIVDSVYYFSWAAQDSFNGPLGIGHLPNAGMNPALIPASGAIGNYLKSAADPALESFDESWWPNDGVVNTRSMRGPQLSSGDTIIEAENRTPGAGFHPGNWYFMGTRSGWDHLDMVGLQTRKNYRSFYLQLARQLAALPPAPGNH